MKRRSCGLVICLLASASVWMGGQRGVSAQGGGARGVGVQIRTEDGRLVNLYDRSYALVVGVSDYTAGWPRLPGVKRDIEEVSRALEAQGFQVTKVENPDAAHLDTAFREFIDTYGQSPDGRLLFYLAGHGHTLRQAYGEEMGYIVPSDAPNPGRDPAGFRSKAVSMEQMGYYAKRIQSKHALFVFDSCFSGSIFALSRAVPENIGYKTSRPVRQFITSGSADEAVPDKSVFREQFVEAIKGEADLNRDGYVTGTELGMFIQDRVVNYTRNAQHPQYGKLANPNLDKGDFVFATGAASNTQAAGGGPEPPKGAAAPGDQLAVELAYWDAIKNSTDPEEYASYLKHFPNGRFSDLARRRSQPKGDAAVPSTSPATADATTARPAPPVTGTAEEHYRVATALQIRQEFAPAAAEYRKAIDLDPGHVAARFDLGHLLYEQGQYAEAEDVLRECVRLSPRDASAHALLGRTLMRLSKFDAAVGELKEALRLSPDDFGYKADLAEAVRKANR